MWFEAVAGALGRRLGGPGPDRGQGINMKKIVLAAAAVMVVTGSASAADMPVKYAPPVKVCAADWFRGGYIGVNGGGVNWTANRTDQDEVLVDTATYVQKKWGGVVGGQIGYNWTTCNTLWGIELDGDWAYAKATTQLLPNSPFFNINIESRFDALLTARTRTGIVLDNLLLYVTGGIAAGHFKTTYTNQFLGIAGVVPGFLFQAESREWRWGLAAGTSRPPTRAHSTSPASSTSATRWRTASGVGAWWRASVPNGPGPTA